MRKTLRLAALLVLAVVLTFWFLRGHNTGWNINLVFHQEKEPVTGIEKQVEEQHFIPGREFLAEGFFLAGLLAAASFIFRKPAPPGRHKK